MMHQTLVHTQNITLKLRNGTNPKDTNVKVSKRLVEIPRAKAHASQPTSG